MQAAVVVAGPGADDRDVLDVRDRRAEEADLGVRVGRVGLRRRRDVDGGAGAASRCVRASPAGTRARPLGVRRALRPSRPRLGEPRTIAATTHARTATSRTMYPLRFMCACSPDATILGATRATAGRDCSGAGASLPTSSWRPARAASLAPAAQAIAYAVELMGTRGLLVPACAERLPGDRAGRRAGALGGRRGDAGVHPGQLRARAGGRIAPGGLRSGPLHVLRARCSANARRRARTLRRTPNPHS